MPSATATPAASVGELVAFVAQHPRLFVLTGAGISTASGIPDYRDHDGSWKRRPPVQYAEFVGDAAMRRRYWARSLVGWRSFSGAQPNPAHVALARLEQAGRVHALVTQNVDGLHSAAGSRAVLDLHGRLDRVLCLDCGERSARATLQSRLAAANPAFAGLAAGSAPDGDADLEHADFAAFEVPGCGRCGGLLKPDVVFYGEGVPRTRVDAALAALASADALLVAGSSLMVYSGFRFARAAAERGLPIAALNLGRTRADALLSLKVAADCGSALEQVAAALG